jgi:predicted anti-sigma-YlaC factor YlaD
MPADRLTCREFVELSTDYLEDALEAPLHEAVERHLHDCVGCRTYLDQQHTLTRLLRRHLRGRMAPAERLRALESFRSWRRHRAVAGTSG